MSSWIKVGSTLLCFAVILGAFGAHGLKDKIDAYRMGVFDKAVFYHFIHALGILIVAVVAGLGWIDIGRATLVSWILLFGIAVFSGSLYLLAVSGMSWLGAITPIGGLSFIVGWAMLAISVK